jgi:hypothetical protein
LIGTIKLTHLFAELDFFAVCVVFKKKTNYAS